MKSYDEVLNEVYQSPRFLIKGFSSTVKDEFIYVNSSDSMIVFLVEESGLQNDNEKYYYVLYSLQTERIVENEEKNWIAVIEELPDLSQVDYFGGRFSRSERKRLRAEKDALLTLICEKEAFTEMEKERYIKYLEDSRELASPSVQKIYDFFIEHVKNH